MRTVLLVVTKGKTLVLCNLNARDENLFAIVGSISAHPLQIIASAAELAEESLIVWV